MRDGIDGILSQTVKKGILLWVKRACSDVISETHKLFKRIPTL